MQQRLHDATCKLQKQNHIYHAPIHRESLLLITGVKSGAMYNFKHAEASAYPAAGPSNLMNIEMPEILW